MKSRKIVVGCRIAVACVAGLGLSMAASAQALMAAPVFGQANTFRVATGVSALPGNDPSVASDGVSSSDSSSVESALPDAPSTVLRASFVGFEPMAGGGQNNRAIVAPIYTKYIPAGWTAQPITAGDKVVIGLKDAVSPFSLLGIVLSAGYSHVTNGQPNYGTNGKAFGKRLGAIALRDTTEGLFTDSVFSPIFHQDPRYYVKGHGHSFVSRLVYAATRPIITRTDGGHETINASLLAGYASSAALADAYFPQINRNFKDTASDFGGSIGGAALGDLVSEFYNDFAVAIHLKKAD
jgi:hypothetical protein